MILIIVVFHARSDGEVNKKGKRTLGDGIVEIACFSLIAVLGIISAVQ